MPFLATTKVGRGGEITLNCFICFRLLVPQDILLTCMATKTFTYKTSLWDTHTHTHTHSILVYSYFSFNILLKHHLYIKVKVKVKSLSRVRLLVTPWTAAYQAPLSMGFSRQEYPSGVPLKPPQLPHPCPRPAHRIQTNSTSLISPHYDD